MASSMFVLWGCAKENRLFRSNCVFQMHKLADQQENKTSPSHATPSFPPSLEAQWRPAFCSLQAIFGCFFEYVEVGADSHMLYLISASSSTVWCVYQSNIAAFTGFLITQKESFCHIQRVTYICKPIGPMQNNYAECTEFRTKDSIHDSALPELRYRKGGPSKPVQS